LNIVILLLGFYQTYFKYKSTQHATSMHIELAPSQIRFTQDSISSKFQNGNNIYDLIDDIVYGVVTPSEIQRIRTFKLHNKYYSVDNRRLYVFREVEKHIRNFRITAKLIHYNEQHESKLTTTNDGVSIVVRGKKPNRSKPHGMEKQSAFSVIPEPRRITPTPVIPEPRRITPTPVIPEPRRITPTPVIPEPRRITPTPVIPEPRRVT
ncbi:uncharacterized protein LOC115211823, partial [Argonauta hians]